MFKSSFSGFSTNSQIEAKKFYSEVLGLHLADETMGLGFDLPGGGNLFIYEKPDHVPATFTVLNFMCDDITQTVTDLQSKGVEFETSDMGNGVEPDEHGIYRGKANDMGPDIAWFKDPSGNVLAVLEDQGLDLLV